MNLHSEEMSIQNQLTLKRETLKKYVSQLEEQRQTLENNHFDLDTVSGQYDQSVILSRKTEYEYLAWTFAAVALFGIVIHQSSR